MLSQPGFPSGDGEEEEEEEEEDEALALRFDDIVVFDEVVVVGVKQGRAEE